MIQYFFVYCIKKDLYLLNNIYTIYWFHEVKVDYYYYYYYRSQKPPQPPLHTGLHPCSV